MIADTVFSPSFGNRPSYLVGRESLLTQLAANLSTTAGSRERASVLLGPRGSGKTVLLWEIAERARKQGIAVASPTVASENMLERVVEKIQDDGARFISQRSTRVSGGNVGALGFSIGLQFTKDVQETKSFEYKLTQLVRLLNAKGHGVLVLIDELQANSPEVRRLVIAYQELVGERLDVSLVMAGLPGAVSATLNDKVLTFLNRAQKTKLPPLAIADVDAFFTHAFRDLGVLMDEQQRKRAAEATQGSPYLLQLIGHYIVLHAQEGVAMPDAQVNGAVAQAQADFETNVCETTLAALSERDVEFAQALARCGGEGRTADIAQAMNVTTDYAQKYRRRLIDAGVVEPAGRGKVRIAVPYLTDYLQRQA